MNKQLLRYFLGLLLFTVFVVPLKSQDLLLQFFDGTEQVFALADVNKLTFNEGTMVVMAKSGSTQLYDLGNVNKLLLGKTTADNESSITGYDSTKVEFSYDTQNNVVGLKNVDMQSLSVVVYNINGAIVLSKIVGQGAHTISVNHFTKGIYLLKAGNQVYKFVKK